MQPRRAPSKLDEGPRPDTSLEGLAKLRPVFAAKGSVTAGNSSQTSDGAGALILASEKALQAVRPEAAGALRAASPAAGVPPEIMGIGPIEAIPDALRYAGLKLEDMGWIELNEAFAAQSLAVIDTVGLDPRKVNPMGGAIALGHPLGATGAIRAATVVHALRAQQPQVRHGDDVRRHRAGRGRHLRTRLKQATSGVSKTTAASGGHGGTLRA